MLAVDFSSFLQVLYSRASRKLAADEVERAPGASLLDGLAMHPLVKALKGLPGRAVQAATRLMEGVSLAQVHDQLVRRLAASPCHGDSDSPAGSESSVVLLT